MRINQPYIILASYILLKLRKSIQKMNESLLTKYVDEIFACYDKDKSGDLDEFELTQFFNEVFRQIGDSTVVNTHDVKCTMKKIDNNFNGRADKYEIFKALKLILSNNGGNQLNNQYMAPNHTQSQQSFPQSSFGHAGYSTNSVTAPSNYPMANQACQNKQYSNTSNIIYSAIQNIPLFKNQQHSTQAWNNNPQFNYTKSQNSNQSSYNQGKQNYQQHLPNKTQPPQQPYSQNYIHPQSEQKSHIINSQLTMYMKNNYLNNETNQQQFNAESQKAYNQISGPNQRSSNNYQTVTGYQNQHLEGHQNSQKESSNLSIAPTKQGQYTKDYPINPQNKQKSSAKQDQMANSKTLPIIYGVSNSRSTSNEKMRQSYNKNDQNLHVQPSQSSTYAYEDPNKIMPTQHIYNPLKK